MQTKKTIFPSNLHAHTFYCDGKNNAEDYILTAIEKGFISVGLSGHSFTKFDTEYCMSEKGTLEYLKELKNLKEKYKNRIQVYVGIEADFYSGFNPKLDENLGLDFRIICFILSVYPKISQFSAISLTIIVLSAQTSSWLFSSEIRYNISLSWVRL